MQTEIIALLVAAASLGFIHTLLGPDHYLPFIMMARAGKWGALKTAVVTVLCGIGHVGSSIVLGFVGIAMGIAVTKLEAFEALRGTGAAWLLIAFGLVYFIWGLRRAIRNKPHTHLHSHGSGDEHSHAHSHEEKHVHIHNKDKSARMTPWVLFTIFIFGPCEPLIPILMYPAASASMTGVILVALVFGVTTISTMLVMVMLPLRGLELIPMKKIEKYTHALAGGIILICGLGIQFLGL